MPITFISAACALATTVTMPTHAAGDRIICHAFSTTTTIPTLPAGWTNITTNATAPAGRIGYKIATSAAETTGTWTNAAGVSVGVWRGSSGVGTPTNTNGSSTVVSYPALTLSALSSGSWVVRAAVHVQSSNLGSGTIPAGYTSRTGLTALQLCDTNKDVGANPTADTQTVDANNGWKAWTYELLAVRSGRGINRAPSVRSYLY